MDLQEKVSSQIASKAKKIWNNPNGSYYDKNYNNKADFVDKFLKIISSSHAASIEELWSKSKDLGVVDCFELSISLLFKRVRQNSYERYKVGTTSLEFYGDLE